MTSTQTPPSNDYWRAGSAPSPAEGPTQVIPGARPPRVQFGPPASQWGPGPAQPQFQQSAPQNYPAGPQWGPPAPPAQAPMQQWGPAPVPPRSNAKMWASIAGAIAVVATVSAVTIGLTAGGSDDGDSTNRAGGTTTISVPVPTEQSAESKPTKTQTPETTESEEPSEPAGELDPSALLLKPKEAAKLVGGTLKVLGERSSMVDNSDAIDQPECLSVWGPADQSSYADSGYDEVALQALKDSETKGHVVIQAAVSFPSSSAAQAYLTQAGQSWDSCAGRTVTSTSKDAQKTPWRLSTVGTSGDFKTISQTPADSNSWSCQRALGASGRIVIDTVVCDLDADGQSVEVAEAIAKKAQSAGA